MTTILLQHHYYHGNDHVENERNAYNKWNSLLWMWRGVIIHVTITPYHKAAGQILSSITVMKNVILVWLDIFLHKETITGNALHPGKHGRMWQHITIILLRFGYQYCIFKGTISQTTSAILYDELQQISWLWWHEA